MNQPETHTIAVQRTRLADYIALTKPEITLLSVLTAVGSAYLALRGSSHYIPLVHVLIGTMLVGAGAGSLNEYIEREFDGMMRRTSHRPLVTRTLSPLDALMFGISLSIIGTLYLAITTNLLAGALAGITLVSYLFIYTPLKRRTPFAIVIGGIPGALPPLIGWTAVRGEITTEGLSLYFILFFWQMPHFLALAWMYRKDYERAGYKVLTTIDPTGALTSRQILVYASALVPASLLPTLVGLTGLVYFFGAFLLSAGFLSISIYLYFNRSNTNARRLFSASLVYLSVLFFLLMVG
jgi:heme o synthase